MEDFHYKYGGSTATRTMKCPGWAAMADDAKKNHGVVDSSSEFADEGTMLHNCCETLELEPELTFEGLLERGMKYNNAVLTEDLLHSKVIPAMEALEQLVSDYDLDNVEAERQCNVSHNIGGTTDISGSSPDVIVTGDYKFGDGNMVFAEDNNQLKFYSWNLIETGAFDHMELFGDTKVALAIIQPSDRRDSTLDVWETTVDEIDKFGDEFIQFVEIAEASKPGENLCSGSHCQYCPANGVNCTQREDEAAEALSMLLPKDKDDVEAHEDYDFERALELASSLGNWITAVQARAHALLESGFEVKGWKLVEKRASRKWVDAEKAGNYLQRKFGHNKVYTQKLLTPAKIDELNKKEKLTLRLDKHIHKVSTGTTLARASDKREAIECHNTADVLSQLGTEGEEK